MRFNLNPAGKYTMTLTTFNVSVVQFRLSSDETQQLI